MSKEVQEFPGTEVEKRVEIRGGDPPKSGKFREISGSPGSSRGGFRTPKNGQKSQNEYGIFPATFSKIDDFGGAPPGTPKTAKKGVFQWRTLDLGAKIENPRIFPKNPRNLQFSANFSG